MSNLDDLLRARLGDIRQQGLYRELREIQGPQTTEICFSSGKGTNTEKVLNFSSNDYLGLANHPRVKQAAIEAIERYGAGSGASRLVSGSLRPHHELEEELASYKKTHSAIAFSSGYATAVGAICALVGKEDVVILDKLVHASIVDAARLSGATIRVFPHNDLERLEQILRWCDKPRPGKDAPAQKLVVTESVFSMDGDHAPLNGLVALKERFGAWLMVDEAHGAGLYGEEGRGLASQAGVAERIEVQMGTLGKAFGSSGGYICGSRNLADFLVNRGRSFIFSTAPVPAAAAAAREAIRISRSAEGTTRRERLRENVRELSATFPNGPAKSAILPLIIGEGTAAVDAAARLREKGFYVPAIRYPTVARGTARLRITLTASHSIQQVQALKSALVELGLAQPKAV